MSDQTDTLGGRLPLADPAALNPAQREIFDRMATRIVPWANDAQFQSVAEDGRLIGPFNPALLNPAITAPFLDLQFGEQVHTSLSARLREVVILAMGAVWQADYELYAHLALARKAGLSEDAARAVATGGHPDDLNEDEKIPAAHPAAVNQPSRRGITVSGGRNRLRNNGINRYRLPHRHLSLGLRDADHVRDAGSGIGSFAMNFASLPDRRADLDPNGPAVSDGTRSLTNAGLLERVRAAGRHLDELGVGAGDVVALALMLRNRVEFVVLMFACWRVGATVTWCCAGDEGWPFAAACAERAPSRPCRVLAEDLVNMSGGGAWYAWPPVLYE